MLLAVLRRRSRCCSYSVWVCGLYCGALHVLKYSRALCPRVFFFFFLFFFVISFSIVIASLGKEGAGLCASRTFVCFFVRVSFCSFSLPLGVGG